MTNDYKENLLEYLTGNINIEEQSNTPFFQDVSVKTWESSTIGYAQVRCKDGNGEYNGKVLCYNSSTMTLIDGDMNIVKTFTSFSSGTPFSSIIKLGVAEDGNIYGIDHLTVNGVDTLRIILLNNISEIPKGYNDYEVILRNSYYVQGYTSEDDVSTEMAYIEKSTQSALYYISVKNSTDTTIMPVLFQINVGSENTWDRLPNIDKTNKNIGSMVMYYDENDTPHVKYYLYQNTTEKDLIVGETIGTNNPTYTTLISNVGASLFMGDSTQIESLLMGVMTDSYNSYYLVLSGVYDSSASKYKQRIRVYHIRNEENKLLFTKDSDNEYDTFPGSVTPPAFGGKVLNDCLLMFIGMNNADDNIPIYFNLLSKSTTVDYFIDTGVLSTAWSSLQISRTVAFNEYNIYKFYHIVSNTTTGNKLITTKIVFNANNYNGENYKDINMLAPRQAIFFDENSNIIFARDLYNKKVYNNQTMATLNIPYNMLNDINIADENLYSETNYKMVNSNQDIIKNVYENLYVNFINAITMQDQNTDIYINNINGATRLNQSSSKVLDYESAKATKARVTYEDNTSYITEAVNEINNNVCTYTIGVHVPSDTNIQKIEIISNDETTSYQTISSLNLENNKYYIITQDVYVV